MGHGRGAQDLRAVMLGKEGIGIWDTGGETNRNLWRQNVMIREIAQHER